MTSEWSEKQALEYLMKNTTKFVRSGVFDNIDELAIFKLGTVNQARRKMSDVEFEQTAKVFIQVINKAVKSGYFCENDNELHEFYLAKQALVKAIDQRKFLSEKKAAELAERQKTDEILAKIEEDASDDGKEIPEDDESDEMDTESKVVVPEVAEKPAPKKVTKKKAAK